MNEELLKSRREKRNENEEKWKVRIELKEARREQKKIWKEEKLKSKEEYRALKNEFWEVPKSVIWEASDHYMNRDMLVNFLKGININIIQENEETKLPSVPYD